MFVEILMDKFGKEKVYFPVEMIVIKGASFGIASQQYLFEMKFLQTFQTKNHF
mgnify:CR=1 FL=1